MRFQELLMKLATINQHHLLPWTTYPSLVKGLRATACIERLVVLIQNHKRNTNNLFDEKISDDEKMWINYIQLKHYLTEKGQLNDEQCKIQLNLKIHEDEIIRLYGRYNADLSEEKI